MFRHRPRSGPLDDGNGLRSLAQRKVQAALAELEASTRAEGAASDQAPVDPIIEQALDRLRSGLGDVVVTDRTGREVPHHEVARALIGPLAHRVRDADTAVVLTEALEADPVPVPDPAGRALVVPVGTGWPA